MRGALGQLLAWSHDAKVAAMDAGLLGSTVDTLFALHGELQPVYTSNNTLWMISPHLTGKMLWYVRCSDSAQLKLLDSENKANRAESRPQAVALITEHLKLLTNFLHHSADVKAAAADAACVHIQRKLWVLQAQRPDACFTCQLLHIAAASVSHCAESQARWHEKLMPTERNADARHILSAIIRLAKKRQVGAQHRIV